MYTGKRKGVMESKIERGLISVGVAVGAAVRAPTVQPERDTLTTDLGLLGPGGYGRITGVQYSQFHWIEDGCVLTLSPSLARRIINGVQR
jgi:hypothetical protein